MDGPLAKRNTRNQHVKQERDNDGIGQYRGVGLSIKDISSHEGRGLSNTGIF